VRKNCAPSDFIFRGIFQTEDEAFAKEKQRTEKFRVFDGQLDHGEGVVLNDVPIEFGMRKKYKQRYVTVVPS
jgi:CRISPR system Cascade subunit CasD